MAIERSRWAAISCVHVPFHNLTAQKSMLDSLADNAGDLTDFVCLGDLFEGAAGSVHPDEHSHTLEDEYEAGAKYLEEIRNVLPRNCRLHWTHGNHDDSLLVNDSRRTAANTRSLITWMLSPWREQFMHWKQYPYLKPSIHDQSGALTIGQCVFTHGWDAGIRSNQNESHQINWATGGWSHRLFVRGHLHTPVDVTQAMITPTTPAALWYCNAGTLGPLRPGYMARKWSLWQPAIVWGECQTNHRPSRYPGKCWDAHVQTLKGTS